MLIRLLPEQIPNYIDAIKETVNQSIPHCDEETKTNLIKELLMETAQCWLSELDDKFDGILITQTRHDIALGKKVFTCLCVYAPEGTEERSFMEGFPTLVKYAKAHDCKVVDFYSDNPELLKYARMFNVIHEATYIQLSLEQ